MQRETGTAGYYTMGAADLESALEMAGLSYLSTPEEITAAAINEYQEMPESIDGAAEGLVPFYTAMVDQAKKQEEANGADGADASTRNLVSVGNAHRKVLLDIDTLSEACANAEVEARLMAVGKHPDFGWMQFDAEDPDCKEFVDGAVVVDGKGFHHFL